MTTVQIKPDHKAIDAYYATLDTLKMRQQVIHEGNLAGPTAEWAIGHRLPLRNRLDSH